MEPRDAALGELIDRLYDLREEKKWLESQASDIKDAMDSLETRIFAKMEEIGVTTVKSTKASVTLTSQLVPQIEDFDAALNWVGEDFDARKHILFRRITSGSFKELHDAGESIPGVSAYNKRGVSLRKLPS